VDLRLPAAALLLAAAAVAGRAADARRATPPPPPGVASLLGGFSAAAAQALWMRAARALEERREDEAIAALRAVVDLEPQLVSAARHAAETIGWDLAAGRPDPVRWEMAREGIAILDGTVRANPGSAAALRERGSFLLLRIAEDPVLDRDFRRDLSADGPVAAARLDLARAADLDREDVVAHDLRALAGLREGVERIGDRRFEDAARALADAADAYDACRAILARDVPEAALAADPTFAALAENRALVGGLLDAVRAPGDERERRLAVLRERHGGLLR
jgi:hypothetical protein